MNLLSIVYSGLFKEMRIHQSAAWLWEGAEAVTVYSIWPNTCIMLSDQRRGERERERKQGEEKKMEGGRGTTAFAAIRKKSKRYSDKKRTNWQKEIVSAFLYHCSTSSSSLCFAPNLFKMSPEPPTPLFASSWQSWASWNIPLQIVSLRQCCLSFFHHRRGSGHTHLSLWTSCPAPSVHCPLCTHTHLHCNAGAKMWQLLAKTPCPENNLCLLGCVKINTKSDNDSGKAKSELVRDKREGRG